MRTILCSILIAVFALAQHSALSAQDFGPPAGITLPEGQRLAELRNAGLKRDRNSIPTLLKAVKTPVHPYDRHTALRALAQLGATEALPIIEGMMQTETEPSVRNYARVILARIRAESRVKAVSDPAERAALFVRQLLAELGMDVNRLNAAVPPEAEALSKTMYRTLPVELYVLRELAEILYRTQDRALADYAGRLGLRFDADWPSALKLRLAPLSQGERIAWLVEELANKKVLTGDDFYAVQLAIDEGAATCRAVILKLSEMDARRESYADVGFAVLFDILRGVGDRSTEPVVAHFLNDRDGGVAHYARIAYPNVSKGKPTQYRAGY